MNRSYRNIVLVIVMVLIIGSIMYLESAKPRTVATNADIVIENQLVATSTTATTTAVASVKVVSDRSAIRSQKALQFPRAKEFVDPTGFINTPAFKLSNIVGQKVVLIDFWTYSCINCQRTIPYLNAWYQKYKDLGLEIVGIHTPEFDFEKDYTNVSKAVADLGIKYPVVMDSNQGTWNAYQNLYWPREYLIDIDGFIVHDHIGEGSYAETEQAIQKALLERNTALSLTTPIPTSIVNPADVISLDESKVQSQETYFGSERNHYLGNGQQGTVGLQTLTIPSSIQDNTLYLDGTWNFAGQYAETTDQKSKIKFKYNAKNVYFVASSKTSTPIKIFEDGRLVNTLNITNNKLYPLIQGSDYGTHTLEIEVDGSGLQAFTFTFG